MNIVKYFSENPDQVAAILGIVAAICGWAATKVKSVKAKKFLTAAAKVANDAQVVAGWVPDLVQEAETRFPNFSGKEKKEWVMTQIALKCLNQGIVYLPAEVSAAIETAILITKNVNARGSISKKPEVPASEIL